MCSILEPVHKKLLNEDKWNNFHPDVMQSSSAHHFPLLFFSSSVFSLHSSVCLLIWVSNSHHDLLCCCCWPYVKRWGQIGGGGRARGQISLEESFSVTFPSFVLFTQLVHLVTVTSCWDSTENNLKKWSWTNQLWWISTVIRPDFLLRLFSTRKIWLHVLLPHAWQSRAVLDWTVQFADQ